MPQGTTAVPPMVLKDPRSERINPTRLKQAGHIVNHDTGGI